MQNMLNDTAMSLKQFLRAAKPDERKKVAGACNGSMGYLYLLAGRHRYASAPMADRIERLSRSVSERSEGRLSHVARESLVRYPDVFGREAFEELDARRWT